MIFNFFMAAICKSIFSSSCQVTSRVLRSSGSAQHSTARHSTARHGHSTAQHSTTQHDTARHSRTARHSTARHGTAQHSTAQHGTSQGCLLLLCVQTVQIVSSNQLSIQFVFIRMSSDMSYVSKSYHSFRCSITMHGHTLSAVI